MNIWSYHAGCAHFVKELGKDDRGEYQTYWKFVLLYSEGSSMQGRNSNEIYWEGPAKIFNNAVGFYGPRGVFGSRRDPQGVWINFFE